MNALMCERWFEVFVCQRNWFRITSWILFFFFVHELVTKCKRANRAIDSNDIEYAQEVRKSEIYQYMYECVYKNSIRKRIHKRWRHFTRYYRAQFDCRRHLRAIVYVNRPHLAFSFMNSHSQSLFRYDARSNELEMTSNVQPKRVKQTYTDRRVNRLTFNIKSLRRTHTLTYN